MSSTSKQTTAALKGTAPQLRPYSPLKIVAPSTRKQALGSLFEHLLEGNIHVVFGRFRLMRRLHGILKSIGQKSLPALRHARLRPQTSSVVQCQSLDALAGALCQDGVALGLKLPDDMVRTIEDHAQRAPCTRWGKRTESGESFLIHEVNGGRLNDGRAVAIADVDQSGIADIIDRISRDPALLEVIRRSFGYAPSRVEKRLFWSIANNAPTPLEGDLRGVYMPSNFHYDLSGMNALYVYFYMTDASAASGAHVMIKGSHIRKPFSTLLASRFHDDGKLLGFYGQDKALTIAGSAGTGFFEDSSCFHKGLVPIANDRLMLQLRYY
ncbi:MAG: hypothetical protein H6905_06570 [Hyphomicrobiales bacterium]|nr:hypothetical protein [Hyphomicrobiales bacterium]